MDALLRIRPSQYSHIRPAQPTASNLGLSPGRTRGKGFRRRHRCTHDPRISFLVQHFLNFYDYRGPHLAFTFNYPKLPTGLKAVLHHWGFKAIDRFVVFSTIERRMYHEYFNIPLDRLEFMHWGVAPPGLIQPITRW